MVDAEGRVVGRLATQIANILRGKHKPTFTPHVDTGDFVVVLNAAKVRFSGRKLEDKLYIRHTGWPGGVRRATALLRFPVATCASRRSAMRTPSRTDVRAPTSRVAARRGDARHRDRS